MVFCLLILSKFNITVAFMYGNIESWKCVLNPLQISKLHITADNSYGHLQQLWAFA